MSGSVRPPRWRRELRSFGELLALCGLAIGQPVLDVFGRAPEHLVFRGADRRDILAFGLLIVLAPPITLWIAEIAVGFVSERARTVIHTVLLGVLAAITVTLVADGVVGRWPALLVGAVVGAAFAAAHRRTRGPRIWLAFLSPAPIVFLAVFLLASPVAPLLRKPAGTLGVSVGDPTRTVVVIFDELPLSTLLDENARIDADLFPNFARLADTSTWFRQTTTISSITGVAVPMMLTGELPTEDSTPDSSSHPNNLFTLVGGAMPVTASEAITRLCPTTVCDRIEADTGGLAALLGDARGVLEQRLSPRPPDVDPLSTMVEPRLEPAPPEPDAETDAFRPASDGGLGRFDRFLDSIGAEPGLHLLHLLLPHTPYRFLPDGTMYPGEGPQPGRDFTGWIDDPTPVATGMQRHLSQLVWTDHLLGNLLDHLEADDLLDDTNLIVTADHGFGYEPGGPVRALSTENLDDDTGLAQILWVPFFVKSAGQTEGRIVDDPVRTIDLTPTIADLLDTDIPWAHSGRSAFDGGSGDPDRVGLHLGTGDRTAAERPLDIELDREDAWSLILETTAASLAPAADDRHGPDRIFASGPRPDLWGGPVPADAVELAVDLTSPGRTGDPDPDRGMLPALVTATTDPDRIGRTVAIAVDDTIWATTTVYDLDGTARIDAILPSRAFRDGIDDPTVHLIDDR